MLTETPGTPSAAYHAPGISPVVASTVSSIPRSPSRGPLSRGFAGCQRSSRVSGVYQGTEWNITGRASGARIGSGNLSLRPDAARLTIQIAHEMMKQHDDLLAAPDLIPEEIGCGFDGCPMTDRGIAQVHT